VTDRKGEARKIVEDIQEGESSKLPPGVASLRSRFNPMERAENLNLKALLKQQEEQIEILLKSLKMNEVLSEVQTPKPIKIKLGKKKGRKRQKSFQLHLSDTHSRELVSLKQTNGRNEHSVDIGRERLRSVVLQTISEMKRESADCEPVHLTVWGGGDWMVNADLHYKMERCVDDEPLVEMEHVYQMLHEDLQILWAGVPTDSNSFIGSFSNHGRDTEKIVPGLESSRSYDTAIYKRLVRDFPDVKFTIAETTWTVEDICGFKTMYTHGHARKSGVSSNQIGMMMPKWKQVAEMKSVYGFDAWVQGHHHTHSVLRNANTCYMQNGSLVGENSYSVSEGYKGELPSQNLVMIDIETGLVDKVIVLYA
jgi:hypothetical protein